MRTRLALIALCILSTVTLAACTSQPAEKDDLQARLDAVQRELDSIRDTLAAGEDGGYSIRRVDHDEIRKMVDESNKGGLEIAREIMREDAQRRMRGEMGDFADMVEKSQPECPNRPQIRAQNQSGLSPEMRGELERIRHRLRPAQREALNRILRHIAAAARQMQPQVRQPNKLRECPQKDCDKCPRKDCPRLKECPRREDCPKCPRDKAEQPKCPKVEEKKESDVNQDEIRSAVKRRDAEIRELREQNERLKATNRHLQSQIAITKKQCAAAIGNMELECKLKDFDIEKARVEIDKLKALVEKLRDTIEQLKNGDE